MYLLLLGNLNSSLAALSQNKVMPTQDDIIKAGAIRYFKRLPIEGWDRLMHLAKMETFHLLLNRHKTNPRSSPFRIFNFASNRRDANIIWTLPIGNNHSEYSELVKIKYGVCAGLTMTLRKLNLLAHYDPKNKFKQKVPPKSDKQAWFKFMKTKIDDIISYNKMSIIPNYGNLLDFSLEPLIKEYLKEHIIRQWELVNINFLQGIYQGYGGTIRKMSKLQLIENADTLNTQLKLGVNPIIFMSGPSQKLFSTDQWIHVVQVIDITKDRGNNIILKVWDPNLLSQAQNSPKLIISNTGVLTYGGKVLAGLYPLMWDTYEIADMVEKNLDFCADRPRLCTKYPPVPTPTPLPTEIPTAAPTDAPPGPTATATPSPRQSFRQGSKQSRQKNNRHSLKPRGGFQNSRTNH